MAVPDAHATGGARTVRRAAAAALLAAVLAVGGALSASRAEGQAQTVPLDAQRAHIRELEAGLVAVDGKAQLAQRAYDAADQRVRQLRERIAENTRELASARVEFRAAQTRLAQRLVILYREQPPTMIEVLVSSGSLADAVDSVDMLRRIERQDRRILERTDDLRRRLAALRGDLVQSRGEAERRRRETEARLGELQSLAGQRRRLLAGARTTLAQMEAAELQRRQAAAAAASRARLAAVTRAEQQASQAASADATPAPAAAPTSAPGVPSPAEAESGSQAPGGASGGADSQLQQIAACESGGNPRAVSPGGTYRGKYQFDMGTWQAVGGSGDPAAASEAEQDMRAAILYQRTGSSSWPVCGAR